jgi:hypothetical protein
MGKTTQPARETVNLIEHLVRTAASKVFAGMPRVRIGHLGDYVLRSAEVRSGQTYTQITVGMQHRGLRLRRICDGAEIKSPGQCYVKVGDLLFSRIDLWQGAIGFVDETLNDGVVTRDFPVFAFKDDDEQTREFMRYVFMSPEFMAQAREASRGTTGRKKIKRPAFLQFHVPWANSATDRAAAVAVLRNVEREAVLLTRKYKEQELLSRALQRSLLMSLFAQDAGIKID